MRLSGQIIVIITLLEGEKNYGGVIQKELSAVHWPVQLPGMGWIDFLEKELNCDKNAIHTIIQYC